MTTTIFACEDKNIFPDPMSLPVKALDLNVEIMDIFSLPDDRAAAFVKLDKQSTDTKDAYQLAIIDKHGNYTLSDVMYVFSLDEEQVADKQIYISSSGDIFVKFQVREIAASNDKVYIPEHLDIRVTKLSPGCPNFEVVNPIDLLHKRFFADPPAS